VEVLVVLVVVVMVVFQPQDLIIEFVVMEQLDLEVAAAVAVWPSLVVMVEVVL
jgi:hypothetical protein